MWQPRRTPGQSVSLTIRAYNVLFGDSILISWDEDDGQHHAWIDFGNFPTDPNAVFEVVYEDVRTRTGGVLDLAAVTHRHLDHLEGFSSLRERFAQEFQIARLWHAHVRAEFDDVFQLANETALRLLPEGLADSPGDVGALYRNNDPLTTSDRMDGILQTFPVLQEDQFAIHRQLDLTAGALPPGMQRMQVEVLAPEEDSGIYLRSLEDALEPGSEIASTLQSALEKHVSADGLDDASPFGRIADFRRLRRKIRTGGIRILAAVDNTRNNTSLVMRWAYEGVRILLTGDAEETSWEVMRRNGVDFASEALKVGHHGSINASPAWSFDRVFPSVEEHNVAIVSTDPTQFTGENEVPKAEVVAGWTKKLQDPGRLLRTDSVPLGQSVSVTFDT